MGERNGAFLALCLLLVGEAASENLAVFAANVLGIYIVQLLKKMPLLTWGIFEQLDSSVLFQARFTIMATLKGRVPSPIGVKIPIRTCGGGHAHLPVDGT